MKKLYAYLIISLLCSVSLTSQTFNWEEQVITNRYENLQSIAVSEDGTTATIVGYGNIMVQSTDGGETWKNTGIFESDDFDYQDISFSGDLGFACAMTGYKVIERSTSDNLYANSPLLKTTDGGLTWELITVESMGDGTDASLHPSAIGNYSVKFMAVEVIDTNTVYVGVYWKDIEGDIHQNVLKSADAGTSWKPLIPDIGSNTISSIIEYNNNIYIAGNKTLYKVAIDVDSVTNLYPIVDEGENDKMFFTNATIAGTELIFPTYADSIRVTSDEGASFSTIPNIKKGYVVYKHDAKHIVVIGGKDDTKATSDGGTTWAYISTGESLWNGGLIGDSIIALGSGNIYTMSTTDIAAGHFSWNVKNMSEITTNLKAIKTSGNKIFITGFSDIFLMSTDGAQTFSAVTLPSKSDMIYASIDMDLKSIAQGSGGAAIASTRRFKVADFPTDGPEDKYIPGFLLSTTDNWASFSVLDDTKVGAKYDTPATNPYTDGCYGQDFYSVECFDDSTFYTFVQWFDTLGCVERTTYGRVFKTTDAGVTWDSISPNLDGLFINAIVAQDDYVYIGGSKTLLKYNNSDGTITSLVEKLNDLGATDPFIQDIIVDDNTLFVSTTSDQVYKSYDGGATFTVIEDLTGASGVVYIDSNSWMTYGSSAKCKYTNDAATDWEGCYPGSYIFKAGIYSNNIIMLCKSKIYKQNIADLDADITGIEEIGVKENTLWVSQNANEIIIKAKHTLTRCSIYNISGQVMKSDTPYSTRFSISTANFTRGIYLVKAEANGQTIIEKLIIK